MSHTFDRTCGTECDETVRTVINRSSLTLDFKQVTHLWRLIGEAILRPEYQPYVNVCAAGHPGCVICEGYPEGFERFGDTEIRIYDAIGALRACTGSCRPTVSKQPCYALQVTTEWAKEYDDVDAKTIFAAPVPGAGFCEMCIDPATEELLLEHGIECPGHPGECGSTVTVKVGPRVSDSWTISEGKLWRPVTCPDRDAIEIEFVDECAKYFKSKEIQNPDLAPVGLMNDVQFPKHLHMHAYFGYINLGGFKMHTALWKRMLDVGYTLTGYNLKRDEEMPRIVYAPTKVREELESFDEVARLIYGLLRGEAVRGDHALLHGPFVTALCALRTPGGAPTTEFLNYLGNAWRDQRIRLHVHPKFDFEHEEYERFSHGSLLSLGKISQIAPRWEPAGHVIAALTGYRGPLSSWWAANPTWTNTLLRSGMAKRVVMPRGQRSAETGGGVYMVWFDDAYRDRTRTGVVRHAARGIVSSQGLNKMLTAVHDGVRVKGWVLPCGDDYYRDAVAEFLSSIGPVRAYAKPYVLHSKHGAAVKKRGKKGDKKSSKDLDPLPDARCVIGDSNVLFERCEAGTPRAIAMDSVGWKNWLFCQSQRVQANLYSGAASEKDPKAKRLLGHKRKGAYAPGADVVGFCGEMQRRAVGLIEADFLFSAESAGAGLVINAGCGARARARFAFREVANHDACSALNWVGIDNSALLPNDVIRSKYGTSRLIRKNFDAGGVLTEMYRLGAYRAGMPLMVTFCNSLDSIYSTYLEAVSGLKQIADGFPAKARLVFLIAIPGPDSRNVTRAGLGYQVQRKSSVMQMPYIVRPEALAADLRMHMRRVFLKEVLNDRSLHRDISFKFAESQQFFELSNQPFR